MAFRKDPIVVGLLLEAATSGKSYEVVGPGEQRGHWLIRQVGGKGSGMERAATDLNDPFKWTRFDLDELPAETQAQTILGQGAAEPAPGPEPDPTPADAPPPEDPPAAPEATVEAGVISAGQDVFIAKTKTWERVTDVRQEGARVVVTTGAGEFSISFYDRIPIRKATA